jgi:hypothetical protein
MTDGEMRKAKVEAALDYAPLPKAIADRLVDRLATIKLAGRDIHPMNANRSAAMRSVTVPLLSARSDSAALDASFSNSIWRTQ